MSVATHRHLTESELRAIAERGAREMDGASADELMRWTEDTFGDDYIVASNMQDGALVHLAAQVHPGVDVLFLETGYHFAETIGTRDAVESVYGVNVIDAKTTVSVAEQDRLEGKDLFARDPARCCALRKVVPLKRELANYSAWVTGIRRVEAPTRANSPLISFDEAFGLVKINPIAAWSDDEMQSYIDEHGILVNPLVDEGYPSIGCAPCTAKPAPGADPRSGRWAGSTKTECGLHSTEEGTR
ncbi:MULTISPECIES: phosphoadenylyl-sulfate reductase [Nocardiaceae]|jgi:phosphoadenosine phosphosulfate reductase|uniref:Adenosine 5'-phosphosulfate reductase n=1 Tax=Rhodococcoides corynebacterioides TaxID=53972 RepID=A0ABS2KTU2_9NOCA|nr:MULTISPECIES: phosphoadenylyl-sulfate reductase [Rhodococcus]KQU30450.1 phosphoadenosine phosphosulfate reductase [Rhodococcus sp. Leaf225]KQU44645.1 phosphoadenosine phosphosulfate reductase [Rhodococcus sp. Leaf258]MBM7415287.1 phosphoadenosine phosphosulfate reductase [Rhodococcus corynebacterioides]MBP1117749.1 phosphoadenosine phosphosulfate reductase [Rhodococcus sp. PvP016]MBY6676141.1 phosphoadenylyl-sulfate reductase [Rhodococcus sp. BP-332]